MKNNYIKIIYILTFIISIMIVNNSYSQEVDSSKITETDSDFKHQEKNSNQTIFDKWILPITKTITLVSLIFGIFMSIKQFKLKVKSEIRLKESANAENDVKLLKLFTEILDIAHGRKNQIISETIIKELFDKNTFTGDLGNLDALQRKIENVANLPIHVGLGAQEAAITAIADLSIKYEILKESGLAGLRVIATFKPDPTNANIERINVAYRQG